jgi:hypothetical protein
VAIGVPAAGGWSAGSGGALAVPGWRESVGDWGGKCPVGSVPGVVAVGGARRLCWTGTPLPGQFCQ